MLNEIAPAAKASRFTEEGGHFYGHNKANGTWCPLHKDGGTFTLREARKLKAAGVIVVPSVTGVFKVLHKQQLVDWKIEQALKVAAQSPYDGAIGTLDDWIDAVMAMASGASMGAANLGTRIHAAIESAIAGQEYEADLDVYVQPVLAERKKLGLVSIASEICVGSLDLGVAGRCDELCEGMTVLDFKSRKTKPNRKAPSYETDVAQLAFYGASYWGKEFLARGRGLIFVISTTIPGLVVSVPYGPEELKRAYEAFEGMASTWRFLNKFESRVITNK